MAKPPKTIEVIKIRDLYLESHSISKDFWQYNYLLLLVSHSVVSKSLQPCGLHQGASHGGSEKPGKLEVGGASRDSTGLGALEEGLISS